MDDQQLLALYREQQAKADAAKAEREKRLAEMLQLRAQESAPVNLTPAAALAKALGGQDVSPAATSVAAQAKESQNRTDELWDQLNQLKGTTAEAKLPLNLLGDQNKQGAILGRFNTAQETGMFKEVKKDFGDLRKPLDEIDKQFNGIEDALVSGDYERIKGQLSNFARSVNSEKGVLTDNDVGRTYIDTVDNIFKRFASRFEKGQQVSPADVKSLSDAIVEARRKTAEVAAAKHQDLVDTYQSNPFGSEVLQKMESHGGLVGGTAKRIGSISVSPKMQEWRTKNFTQQTTPSAPGGIIGAPVSAQDPRARLEELRKKAAGG